MRFEVDFRFNEIVAELWATKEYLSVVEQQLPLLKKQTRDRIEKETKEHIKNLSGDERECEESIAAQEIYDINELVLSRFFLSPIIVMFWSMYESAIIEIAKHIQVKCNHDINMNDLRGNFLVRSEKYFKSVLDFPLITDSIEKRHIEKLMVLRNAIVHGSGRKEIVNKDDWKKIEQWQEENEGISIVGYNCLSFSLDFIKKTHKIVDKILNDLINRVKKNIRNEKTE